METYLNKLEQIKNDPYQFTAFKSNISTVVKAGPGSGKTTVLTLKIMRLLNENITPPRGLACITYNKEAVKEFTKRLTELGYSKRNNVFLGTVHAFCIAEVISPFAHLYDYNIPMPLKIVTEKQKRQIFAKIVSQLNYNPKEVKINEMDKERTLNIDGISSIEVEPYDIALNVAKEYEKKLHSMGMVDFIDIVKYATLLIQNEEYVRNCLEAKFPWLLIDEYQDLGKPLHEMVLSLFNKTNIKIFAVGDPDQSIYSFNGAIPDYLNELFNNPNIKPVELKVNYRSHQEIIDASVVGLNQLGRNYSSGSSFDKEAEFHFITCEEELEDQYQKIINQIIPDCKQKGIPLEEICILFQSAKQIRNMSRYLNDANIPYYVSKFDFKRSDIVIWLEKCAAWTVSNSSESFTRLFEFWITLLQKHSQVFSSDELIVKRKRLFTILTNSTIHLNFLNNWLSYIIQKLELYTILNDSNVYPDEIDNLKILLEVSQDGNFHDYDVSKFSNLGKPLNQITLSTRHSAKGLEFEVVIILGMEKGNFPFYLNENDPDKLNEDRRVFFVCVSRAKRVCYLLRSKKFTKMTRYGLKTFFPQPSMFWEELYQSRHINNHILN
ncbi:ATP-dependent helicase [Virgibacillus salexigens]|uniref:ATP-dependent helicase n=1 Tax=Virgibacillus salexigens TaxID=61016 RepID=UPI00190A2BD4|nr:ATP-dependent helicase [Virgibacillus salexigens]